MSTLASLFRRTGGTRSFLPPGRLRALRATLLWMGTGPTRSVLTWTGRRAWCRRSHSTLPLSLLRCQSLALPQATLGGRGKLGS
eukprot:2355723-Alexandrium_andersonii.AAC.1